MTRLAAIDIGTNSTKFTLADVAQNGAVTVVAEDSAITRLGEGVDAAGRLNDSAMARTLEAITRFAQTARAQGAQRVLAAGTSALRDAANGAELVQKAQDAADVQIEIITGDREAQLAYAAVRSDDSLHLPAYAALLVFDIGGGSTELTLGDTQGVQNHISLNIGAVRLTERFLKADPPTVEELSTAARFADQMLAGFPAPEIIPAVVGIGGTALNLASVTRALPKLDPDAVHGDILTFADVDSALSRFARIPLAERRRIPGLEPARADIITAGILLLGRLLAHFRADRFTVSARGLRYGLLAEQAKRVSF